MKNFGDCIENYFFLVTFSGVRATKLTYGEWVVEV